MKKLTANIVSVVLSGYMITSCYSEKIMNGLGDMVECIQPEISTFYDSICPSFPGKILVMDDYVAWEEPHSTENFLHMISKNKREKLKPLGNIGNGLHDFTAPYIEKGDENELIIYDFDMMKKAIIMIDKLEMEENGVTYEDMTYNRDILTCAKLSDGNDLLFSPENNLPFGVTKDQLIYYSGKFPVGGGMITPDDRFNYFQGVMAYNANKDILLYSTYSFRYMALYRRDGNRLQLIKETEAPDCSIKNNRLRLGKNKTGISEIALTKNYVVTAECLEENVAVEDLNLHNGILPKSLCVYDYNLQLKKVLEIDRPIMRIGAHSDSDTIFAIIEDPEYKMVTISF